MTPFLILLIAVVALCAVIFKGPIRILCAVLAVALITVLLYLPEDLA